MQPDQTLRQPEARQDNDLRQELPEAVFAGECGDPIWEYAAHPAQTHDPALPAQQRHDDESSPREQRVRPGRVIDLIDRRSR
jgi:hypothetical protein